MKEIKRSNSKIKTGKWYATFTCETVTGSLLHTGMFSVKEATTLKELKEHTVKGIMQHQLIEAIEKKDTALMMVLTLGKDVFGRALDTKCWEFDTKEEAAKFRKSEEERIETSAKSKLN